MDKLVLLDGHSLAYRAYYALPPEMATSAGEPTNATFGFSAMLLDVLAQQVPSHIAVAFDVGKTWRHERYAEYKGHRLKAPDDLKQQIGRIQEVVRAFNIPIFTAPGYEADDVLATLARQAEEAGAQVLIVTGDTDAHQLVTEKITVQSSGRSFRDTHFYDPAAIQERYGLVPPQLVDYKALLGDKSDNIPGVRGIGKKTATSLLQQYETLAGIYEHLEALPTGARNRLVEGREDAFLSQELGRIDSAVPGVELDMEACRTRDFDRGTVYTLFRDLQFASLIDRVPEAESAPPPPGPTIETDYQLVGDEAALDALAGALAKASAVTLDVETDSTDAVTTRLVGLAVGLGPGHGRYIPIAHRHPGEAGQMALGHESPVNLPLDLVLERLKPILERPELEIYAHNAKFDLEVLVRHGFPVNRVSHDSLIGAWLLNPGSREIGLKPLAQIELGESMTEITELIGRGRKQITMDLVPVDEVVPYASADVDMTSRLVPLQKEQLAERSLLELFRDVEMPLIPVLVDMELAGIAVDATVLAEVGQRLESRLAELNEQIVGLAGVEFNLNSPQQLSEVLFDRLELDRRKSSKTKHGHYSTAVNVLESLRDAHPIIAAILEQRSLQKLMSTYIDQLARQINPETGRIHTDLSMTVAETGRLSSRNPNLQNIPVRTEEGREIRRAFVAPPGHYLLATDYSQVELRVLAHLSEDEAMIEAFQRGEDIHATTAARLYHVEVDEVTTDMRRIAKIINFGLLYGMSAYRLAREASLEYAEAEEHLHTYFRSFPRIEAYLEGIVAQARESGYAETIMGRRRYFNVLQRDPKSNQGRAAERAAKNHPIQGSAAEIIKVAMIRIQRKLQEQKLRSRMVLQVHDELLFDVPEEELQSLVPMVIETMCDAMTLKVPLKVDAKVGLNWAEMHPIEDFIAS